MRKETDRIQGIYIKKLKQEHWHHKHVIAKLLNVKIHFIELKKIKYNKMEMQTQARI